MPSESAFRDRIGTGYELIETMRFEDGTFVRLDRHLERLRSSAQALGFRFDSGTIIAKLEALKNGPAIQRVRLTLSQEGTISISSAPFAPLQPDTIWRLGIAQTRLDSSDTLLQHKTTRRAVYEAARAEYGTDEADEVLLLNERGEVCEGTITSLFADFGEGVLVTPPLSCGLLAGVLRASMLAGGTAREAVITPQTLETARAVYLGNSLRGLVRTRLISGAR